MPKLKRILIYPDGVTEKQVYPVWKPWANTLAYFPLSWDGNDYSWNNKNLTSYWTTSYTTVWGVISANFGGSNYLYNSSLTCSSIGQTFTIAWWFYSSWQLWVTCMSKSWGWNWWALYCETGLLWRIRAETQNNNSATRFMPSISYVEWWHHLAFTHNSSWWAIYYDGVSKQTWSMPMWLNWYLVLGGLLDSSTYYFNWNLSNLIIENTVRDATKVADYYNLTKTNYGL